jgi:hypothetical protein
MKINKKILKKFILNIFFISIIFFTFSGCHSNREGKKIASRLTREEKKDLKAFFYHLLLKNSGIYVLHGSKPIVHTLISINTPEEDRKIFAEMHPEDRKPTIREIIFHYLFKDNIPFYIQQWDRVKDRVKMNNYLIVVCPNPFFDDPSSKSLYFINITNTIALLQKHYPLFKEIIGIDFDPLELIYNIEDPTSVFWEKINKNYLANGLLFGFGDENARFFAYWCGGCDNRKGKELNYFKHAPFNCSDDQGCTYYFNYSYQHFPLPTFRHFENDPVLEKYKKERVQIKKNYMLKDSLEVTLQKLTEIKPSVLSPFSKRKSPWLHFLKKIKLI